MTTLTLSKALNEGLRKALEDDPKVLIMGEDVGKLGGVFRVTDGLQKDFGEDRVIDTPLAESGIVGTAIGLALRGYRPVCEIQFDGFVFPAFDQIVSQLAKMRYRSRGNVSLPVVIRIPCGGGIGAVEHHSESPEVLFAHTAGLRVVACADAADAFTMIQQAIRSDDPVIFFEPKRRYWDKGEVDTVAGAGRRAAAGPGQGRARGHRRDLARLRPAGADLPGGRARRPRGRPVAASRSSTCARCPRWTWRRSAPRSAAPAAAWSRTRRRCTPASAPRSPPGSPSSASTTWRRRCCGSAASPPPTRRPGSRTTTCPTWTGSWTPSTARSVTEGRRMTELKEFRLPDVGEGLTEADIVAWHVKPGDQVEVDQIIVEIETAKAVVELPSPWDGTVARLLAEEGQTVDVGTPIIAVEVGAAPDPP